MFNTKINTKMVTFSIKYLVNLFIFVGIFDTPIVKSESHFITGKVLENWGNWNSFQYCPEDTFVRGIKLKTSETDTAVNGVEFLCGEIGNANLSGHGVKSKEDVWGSWRDALKLEGGKIGAGFQLKYLPYQGIFYNDLATTNVMLCTGGKKCMENPHGINSGLITGSVYCNDKYGLCGISTQLVPHGSGDEVALNNLRGYCCEVPDPAKTCKPEDVWKTLVICENQSSQPIQCTYEKKVGVSISVTETESNYIISSSYWDIGFSLQGSYMGLEGNFKGNLGGSEVTGYNWTLSTVYAWSEETKVKVKMEVAPWMKSRIEQIVGGCNFYTIGENIFRVVEYNYITHQETIRYL